MNNPTEILLSEIEEFLSRRNLSPTAFSKLATHDPNFIRNLRKGREPRFNTVKKVRDFMSQQEPAA